MACITSLLGYIGNNNEWTQCQLLYGARNRLNFFSCVEAVLENQAREADRMVA